MAKLTGITRRDFIQDASWGVALGVMFIVLNKLLPSVAIGLPQRALQLSGTVVVAVLLAPLFEEILFRGVLQNLTLKLTKQKYLALAIVAIAFSAFHFIAYGASLEALNASFFGAAVFSVAASFLVLRTKSLIPAIIAHAIFNGYLLSSFFLVIGV